jgi:hypothetical protein
MRTADSVHYWGQIVRGVYREVPGLLLTRSQVKRLWGLDIVLSDRMVDALVDERVLEQTPDGGLVYAGDGRQ